MYNLLGNYIYYKYFCKYILNNVNEMFDNKSSINKQLTVSPN